MPETSRPHPEQGEFREYKVPRIETPRRVDHYLVAQCVPFSRSRVHKLMEEGLVLVNGLMVSPSHKVRMGDTIQLLIPPPRQQMDLPQKMDLQILYEDETVLVLNKPAGLVVHPAPGHPNGTLVNGLLAHFGQNHALPVSDLANLAIEAKESDSEEKAPPAEGDDGEAPGKLARAGLVHRLDQDTSGVMVIGKTEYAVNNLMVQFRDRIVSKRYLALVSGIPKKRRGEIDAPLGRSSHDRKMFAVREDGKQSTTRYRVITSYRENCALVDITLLTGRTHQIRVHFKHIGHPLLGDKVYAGKNAGSPERYPRQMLHAAKLTFLHPETGVELAFEAPLPDDFSRALSRLTPLEQSGPLP